ncbi:MAG: FecR domain-containing protein [Cyclobacteriaceae bacterium]
MDSARIRYLIVKFNAGEISAAEKAELDAYWETTAHAHQRIDFLDELEKTALQQEMFAQIHQQTGAAPQLPRKKTGYYRVAAAISLLLLAGVTWFAFFQQDRLTYTTAYGTTQRVVLPDSSVVTLNANSRLEVPRHWPSPSTHRQVWLEGEAFFEIQPDTEAPFTVFAGGVAVKVLGTSFNVQDRRGHTQVVLNTGKVTLKLADREAPLTMQPGDLVRVSGQEKKVEQRLVDPSLYSSWKDHTLTFQDTPLAEIAMLLEDNYGYEVRIIDPQLAQRRFTGSVPSEDINMLLDKLSLVFGIQVSRTERRITLEQAG